MKSLALLAVSLSLSFQGCSSTDFGGGGGGKPPAPATKDSSKDDSVAKATSETSDPGDQEQEDSTDTETAVEPKDVEKNDTKSKRPKPPVGPGSDLTLTINDTDSKLDSFQIKNTVSQEWLPLTWHQGVQQIQGACSPDSKTTLQLQMHAKSGLFSQGGDLQTGTCNAPLTQTSPTTVDVGVAPSCDKVKGRFSLSCSGSASLRVVP